MQQSLSVLSNADDYEGKKMQLEGLKNRLEASASPLVVKAFTTSNLGNSLSEMYLLCGDDLNLIRYLSFLQKKL